MRHIKNPLITPADIVPSKEGFKVECVFNCGVVKFQGETLLLLRVAESIISQDESKVVIPFLEWDGIKLVESKREFDKNDERFEFKDSRVIRSKTDEHELYLTSLSHFRIARSKDGVNFDIDQKIFMYPETQYEAYGCEDPRITQIEGRFYINYSAVSSKGISTGLAVTDNFKSVERLGVIFCPDNRDVCLFPEKIDGKYMALHRPMPKYFGRSEMWMASSPDLIHWGNHEHLLGASSSEWDSLKIGGGAQMLKTEKGWLQIYHGVDVQERYCLGALLLDSDNPTKILAKSKVPLLEPTALYETEGFFGQVVFTCGALIEGDVLKVYYGASDEVVALAEISLEGLYKHLGV